jgi:hypothetical protein
MTHSSQLGTDDEGPSLWPKLPPPKRLARGAVQKKKKKKKKNVTLRMLFSRLRGSDPVDDDWR